MPQAPYVPRTVRYVKLARLSSYFRVDQPWQVRLHLGRRVSGQPLPLDRPCNAFGDTVRCQVAEVLLVIAKMADIAAPTDRDANECLEEHASSCLASNPSQHPKLANCK